MDKRVRLIRAHDTGSLIQEMAGDKVVNQVFLISRYEAMQLWQDLDARYGFINQAVNTFPTDLFREAKAR